MIAILLLASFGIILNVIGRWTLVRESDGLGRGWRFALALLPGAELAFIVQRGERARSGSILCAFSIALMLPLIGQATLVLRQAGLPLTALFSDPQARALLLGEDRPLRDLGGSQKRERVLAAKETKLRELSDYLERWHLLLAERRDMMCEETAEETRRFNEDAAAYHGLLTAARTELAEWKGLAKGREPITLSVGTAP